MSDLIKQNNCINANSIKNLSNKIILTNKLLKVSEKKIINFVPYNDYPDNQKMIEVMFEKIGIQTVEGWETLSLFNLNHYKICICHCRFIWTENDFGKFKSLIYHNPDIIFIVRSDFSFDEPESSVSSQLNDIIKDTTNIFIVDSFDFIGFRTLVHKCNQNNNNFQSIL